MSLRAPLRIWTKSLLLILLGVCPAAVAFAAPVLNNPGFEADALPAAPGVTTAISGWMLEGTGGLNGAGMRIFCDNGAIPEGDQVAFIANLGSLGQDIAGFEKGHIYKLRFRYTTRAEGFPTQPNYALLRVTLNREVVMPSYIFNVEPHGSYDRPFCLFEGTVSPGAGTHRLVFEQLQENDWSTLVLDQIELIDLGSGAPEVANPSFEDLGDITADQYDNFAPNSTFALSLPGWHPQHAGLYHGIAAKGGAYWKGGTAEGSHAYFLQGFTSQPWLCQTVGGLEGGKQYRVRLQAALAPAPTGAPVELAVFLGSRQIVPPTDPGFTAESGAGDWPEFSGVFTPPETGHYILRIGNNDAASNGFLLIDNVRIEEGSAKE